MKKDNYAYMKKRKKTKMGSERIGLNGEGKEEEEEERRTDGKYK